MTTQSEPVHETVADLSEAEVRERALAMRIKRMATELTWSVVIASVIDRSVRIGLSHGESIGLNIGFFGLVAILIHYGFKAQAKKMDSSSLAWRYRSPWLFVFWPIAVILLLVFVARFI